MLNVQTVHRGVPTAAEMRRHGRWLRAWVIVLRCRQRRGRVA